MILLFLKGLWGKVSFKLFLAIALALVCYFSAKAYVDAKVLEERNRWMNAPADTVRVVERLTSVIHDTTYKYIEGVVHDTVDLSSLTRAQLERAARSFSVQHPITVSDEKQKVGVSFDLSFTANPIGHSITDLKVSNIFSTYPKETVTVTKTVFEPYRANLLDLFVESKIGGVFGTRGMAGYLASGIDLNISEAVQLSGGLGAASQNRKTYGLWTAGIKLSTR